MDIRGYFAKKGSSGKSDGKADGGKSRAAEKKVIGRKRKVIDDSSDEEDNSPEVQKRETKENLKKQSQAGSETKDSAPSLKKAKSSKASESTPSSINPKPIPKPTKEETTEKKIAKKDESAKPVSKDKKETSLAYDALASVFEEIDATTKRLEIQQLLTKFFISVKELCSAEDCSLLISAVYLAANKVAPDFKGIELGCGDSILAKAIEKVTGRTKKAISAKYEATGDLGLVAAEFKKSQRTLFGRKPQPLTLARVHSDLLRIAKIGGQEEKSRIIEKLLVAASSKEAKYLVRCLQGKLRIGLAEQTVIIALAHALAGSEEASKKEEAAEILKQVYSELPIYDDIIQAAMKHGIENLRKHCKVRCGVPLKPMLAKPMSGISQVLDRFADVKFTCEYKYDGERAQIHFHGTGNVKIYSRNSEDNTGKYPDLISGVPLAIADPEKVKSFILDSEVVAYDVKTGKLLPFQNLSTRARKDVKESDIKVQVIICAFDLLFLNGESLLEMPLKERRALLKANFKEVEHKFSFAVSFDGDNSEDIEVFLNKAVEGSCEGLMVKTLNDFYQPAKRSLNWLKLKKDYMDGMADSLDLVPIGAYYGKGKRTGVFGAYIVAAYDEDEGEFQSITKIGTGFKDQDLETHNAFFKNCIAESKPSSYVCDMKPDVWFHPKQVWEVRAADLSISPIHKAAIGKVDPSKGIALRFPRFIRIRDDKQPEDATTSTQVAEFYRAQKINAASNKDEDDW